MADAKELFLAGKKLKEEKKHAEAVEKLKECLAVDDKYVFALHAIVQSLTELGRHEEAIEHAKRIVELEPNDHFSYIAVSRAYQRAGMIPEAEHYLMLGQQAQHYGRP
jgi:tetratricopeptide (TPR) repeat protein